MDENDAPQGGEAMSLDDAAKAYAATLTREPQGQPEAREAGDEANADELEAEAGAEGETENDGQAEDEAAAEPETEQGRYVARNGRVKLPDGSESTVDDLIQGNLRDRDYRQKTMAHAEEVKSFRSQSDAFKASEQQFQQQQQLTLQVLQSIVGDEPDPSLLQSDPMRYMQEKANREGWLKYLGAIQQQSEQTAQQRRAQQDGEMRNVMARESEALLAKVPAFRDQQKLSAFAADIDTHAQAYGFAADDVKNAIRVNHKLGLVLKDALAYRKLQANKANVAQKVENRPPVIKGGKRLGATEQRARQATDAMSRLKQSGTVDDAVTALLALQK